MIRYFRIRDKKLQLDEQTGANTDAVTVVRLSSLTRELASFNGKSDYVSRIQLGPRLGSRVSHHYSRVSL